MTPLLQPWHFSPDSHTTSPTQPARRNSLARLTSLLAALVAIALAGSLAAPASAGPGSGVASATPAVGTAPAMASAAALGGGARFQLATFNILGSNHTRNSRRYAGGKSRARITARIIKGRGTDVIGMQEVQRDQLQVLKRKLGGYTLWPRNSLGRNGYRLQIAYRNKRFRRLDKGHITTTFSRQQRPIPWVRLRDRRTGRAFFFITIHNSPGGQEAARDSATRKEIGLVRRLHRRNARVFIAGDANEHSEFFCKVGGATRLRAPQGGNPDARGCRKPQSPRLIIDWIMGGAKVRFSSYAQARTRLVRRASDHHYVQTTVALRR